MTPSQIALYVGLAVVLFGALVWAFKKNEPTAQNVIKVPGGFEFTLNTPAIAIMVIGVILVIASSRFPEPKPAAGNKSDASASVDPGLTGSWDGEGEAQSFKFAMHFTFGKDGTFSRNYTAEENGLIKISQDELTIVDSNLPATRFKYQIIGSELLKLGANGSSYRLKRIGRSTDNANPFLGTWQTTFLYQGANWTWTLDIQDGLSYHSSFKATDDGPFAASNGELRMVSNWDPAPITGAYKILSPDSVMISLYPFGWFKIRKT